MKKLVIFCLIISSLFLAGCNSVYREVSKTVSEVRYSIYLGETDTIKATFMCGKREKDYVINGYNTPLIDFGIVTIALKKSATTDNAKIVLTVDTNRYEDTLEKNPFDDTLVADLKIIPTASEITLKVYLGNDVQELTLNCLNSDWKVDHQDALKLACKTLKGELKTQIDGTYKGEVYVKIIEDTKVNKGQYYWYVSFAGRDGIKHTVIINPNSGEVLAKS